MTPIHAVNAKSITDLPPELQALALPEEVSFSTMGRPRMTIEQFAHKLENHEVSAGRFSFPFGVFRTHHVRLLATCKRHNVTWAALPVSLVAGCGCFMCKAEKQLDARLAKLDGKVTYDQLAEAFALAAPGRRLLFAADAETWRGVHSRRKVTVFDEETGTIQNIAVDDLIEAYNLKLGV